jgi:hypothetical protein
MWLMSVWSSNTNAVLTDQCQALGNVTVNLEVTEDLVTFGDGGFSLQLNTYPLSGDNRITVLGKTLDWIQFVFQVNNIYGPNTAAFQWQAFALTATPGWPQGQPQGTSDFHQPIPGAVGDLGFHQPSPVITSVPRNRLPKGSNLTIALITDPSTHVVTQANFTIQLPGQQPVSLQPPLNFPAVVPFRFVGTNNPPGVTTAQFPISGFQVNLVGPDGSNATFTSGAGVLSYSVPEGSSLSVQNGPVGAACGQYQFAFTGETSNILYGPVTSPRFPLVGQPPTLSQSFGIFRGAQTFSAVRAITPSGEVTSTDAVYVIRQDGTLWLEQAPFGPGNSTQVDANAIACSAVDANTVFVVGSDGNLWREHAPFGRGHIPPKREPVDPVDGNAVGCSAANAATVYVLDSDRNLWIESAPFPTIPAERQGVASVGSAPVGCSAVDDDTAYVVDDGGNVWLVKTLVTFPGPPKPILVDGSAVGCSAVDASTVYVLGNDGNLWSTPAPFGQVANPNRTLVATNVVGCSAVDANKVYVLDRDGNLWLEQAPFPPKQVDSNVMLQPVPVHGLVRLPI